MNDEFKTILALPDSESKQEKCYYPFRLYTYGRGCVHDCRYCYSRNILSARGQWGRPAPVDPRKVREALARGMEGKGPYAGLLRSRIPVRLGGMTDCFGGPEREHRVTLATLRALRRWHYPVVIMTKSPLVAEDEYLEAMDPRLTYVQVTVTTPDDEQAKKMEPGAAPTSARLEALRKVTEAGFTTAARIHPLVPRLPDRTYASGAVPTWRFRYFDWDLVDMCADTGTGTIITGFMRLFPQSVKDMADALGRNVKWLFPPGVKKNAYHYSRVEKAYYYDRIRKAAGDRGVAFSVCYDNDEDYEAFRPLWANPHDCCNGLGNVPGFEQAFPVGKH